MGRIRFRHFCQSVFGGSNRARSPRLELLDNNQACVQLLSPGKCMPAVKPKGRVGGKNLLRSQRRWWTPLSAVEVGPHLLCSLLSLQQFSSEVVSLDMVEAISMILPPAISYGGLPVCWLVRRA